MQVLSNFKVMATYLQKWYNCEPTYTANVLSAEIADECLQTKSKDNLQ